MIKAVVVDHYATCCCFLLHILEPLLNNTICVLRQAAACHVAITVDFMWALSQSFSVCLAIANLQITLASFNLCPMSTTILHLESHQNLGSSPPKQNKKYYHSQSITKQKSDAHTLLLSTGVSHSAEIILQLYSKIAV